MCRLFANSSSRRSKPKSKYSDLTFWIVPIGLTFSVRFGWFWECPNGDKCQYRHALPPGFVLKSQKKALDEAAKANTISLEEFLEVEVSIRTMILVNPT